MKNDSLDILLDRADFVLYCDFCRILSVLRWNMC